LRQKPYTPHTLPKKLLRDRDSLLGEHLTLALGFECCLLYNVGGAGGLYLVSLSGAGERWM
jgi:hypothetical protein